MESNEALAAASEFLRQAGFQALAEQALQTADSPWTTLEMRRGRKSAVRARGIVDTPQQIRLEWDRGRVTLAASIEPVARSSFALSGFIFSANSGARISRRKAKDYSDLLIAVSQALEQLLAARAPSDAAARDWLALEARLVAKARRAHIRRSIFFLIALVAVIAFITIAIIAIAKARP